MPGDCYFFFSPFVAYMFGIEKKNMFQESTQRICAEIKRTQKRITNFTKNKKGEL